VKFGTTYKSELHLEIRVMLMYCVTLYHYVCTKQPVGDIVILLNIIVFIVVLRFILIINLSFNLFIFNVILDE